jgi:prephenate dehydrogenase
VVLAVPVAEAIATLARLRPSLRADALVTDVCSTKRSITAAATAAGLERQFVGAHPLTGDHAGGWSASRRDLFAQARVYLCPNSATPEALAEHAAGFWRRLGAEPVVIAADTHDRLLAFSSHLPQACAYALAATLAGAGVARADLGPGGRDTMRLAASPAGLWTGIMLDNAGEVRAALAALRGELALLEDALDRADARQIQDLFDAARNWYRCDEQRPAAAEAARGVVVDR